MSVKQLVPLNALALASAPATPTLRQGDLYYNTSTGLMVYDGANWQQVSATSTVSEIDAGVFDSIAPYNGGQPTTTATQTFNGGTP